MVRKLMTLLAIATGAAVLGSWQDVSRYVKIKMASSHPGYVPVQGRKAYLAHGYHVADDFDPARRGGPARQEPAPRAGRR